MLPAVKKKQPLPEKKSETRNAIRIGEVIRRAKAADENVLQKVREVVTVDEVAV